MTGPGPEPARARDHRRAAGAVTAGPSLSPGLARAVAPAETSVMQVSEFQWLSLRLRLAAAAAAAAANVAPAREPLPPLSHGESPSAVTALPASECAAPASLCHISKSTPNYS